MPAHRRSKDEQQVGDRTHRKKPTPIAQEPLGPPPAQLSPVELEIWNDLIATTPRGIQLIAADRYLLEIAAMLIAEQRHGTITAASRNHLLTALHKLGRSPTSRYTLGISEQPEPSTDDAFVQFAN
jgi:hypothetical protein